VHSLHPGNDGQTDFSELLRREYSAEGALLLGSGTQALRLAIRLAIGQVGDDVVALPAFTCFAVASAAVGERARLRFYDVDPSTLAPDLESLEATLKRGARIAVVTPLYGFPVDWDAIAELLARHGAIGIEDAAQGDHASWRGRPVGSLGPISVLSFGRGKGWTGGSGGALLVRDQAPWSGLSEALALLSRGRRRRPSEVRVLGALTAQWALGRPIAYGIPYALPWLRLGETVYRDAPVPQPMTRAASACLATTRPAGAREAAARRVTAIALTAAIGVGPSVRPIQPLRDATPGYLRLPVRLAHGLIGFSERAAALRLGLASSYPSVLAALPQVRPWVDDVTTRWPGSEELVQTLWTVPTHSRLSDEERAHLITLLQDYQRLA
jgi:dTDP-4-amino-4,6-dideoxygalactose transaminase